MFNLKLYLQQLNCCKKEERCIKCMKHSKCKNNNSKSNNKHLKVLNKISEKEICKFKYI